MIPPGTGAVPSAISADAEAEFALRESEIESLRDCGIAAAAMWAGTRSPFYARRFAEAGIDPATITGAAALSHLPLTSRADLAEAGRDVWAAPMAEIVDISSTSGTTGEPLLYPQTRADLLRLARNEEMSLRCAGITSDDSVLLAVTMDRCFIAGLAYYEGLRRIGATTLRIGSSSPSILVGFVERVRPSAIISVPSFLRRTAEFAAETGVDLRALGVRTLVCIGEPIRSADFTLNPLGEALEAAWGARVLSTYGVTELATSFCECSAGAGGHLNPSLLHVEILDREGRPVSDGEIGEVIATPFGVEAMPVLRFRTGDLSFIRREACACGRIAPRLGPILGRLNQMMKVRGTTLFPAAVQRVLDAIPEVRDYAMVVHAPTPLSDELDVHIALRAPTDANDAARRIGDLLQGALKVRPTIHITDIAVIERMQAEGNPRKRQVFIDRRTATHGA